MLCRNPYVNSKGHAFGCGQCMPCRYNKRRKWTHRILLEAAQYKDNTFVTLTYEDDKLPVTDTGNHTLVPKDLQDFIKRLRYHYSTLDMKFRFFAVGEYGDQSWRPHYHAALFNVPTCSYGSSRYSKVQRRCCANCELLREVWGNGHVFLGTLESDSAGYVAGYVTKKMTRADDPRLLDRYPEFTRMSLRPGIGADAMFEVADVLMRYQLEQSLPDVPSEMQHGMKKLPLDRYLRRKLREMVGKDVKAPPEVIAELQAEMQDLYDRAKEVTSAPGMRHAFRYVLRDMIVREGDHGAGAQHSRQKLFQPRRSL